MNIKKFQNKKTLALLGVIIIGLICVPLVILAFVKYSNGYTIERVYYEGHESIIIPGLIYRPNPETFQGKRPGVICLHDFFGSKETVDRFSEDLVRAGYVVLAYDQRGFGNSKEVSHLGDPNYEIKDLELSVEYLKLLEYVDENSIGLIGIGYGGALTIMGAGVLGTKINASFAMSSYSNLTECFQQITFNSIHGNIMRTISKYLGYIPNLYLNNELTEEQYVNVKGFLNLISSTPSMAAINKLIIMEDNKMSFNQTLLNLNSPINSIYASNIPNNSLYMAVGTEDQIFPNNFSESVVNLLLNDYNIEAGYRSFEDTGHNLESYKLDATLVNFFNLKLRNIPVPNNNYLANPVIPETDELLVFEELPREIAEDENIFLAIYNLIKYIPLIILIPYIISIVLLVILFAILFLLKKEDEINLARKRKTEKKEYVKKHKNQKTIVRRIGRKQTATKPVDLDDDLGESDYFYNKNIGVFILLITLANLIIIPTIGLSYIDMTILLLWLMILVSNIILSLLFFTKFEGWKWKASTSREKNKKDKRTQKLIVFLRNNPFFQVIFYLLITFGVVLFIAFVISPIQFSLVEFGLNQIFSTLIITGIVMSLIALILLWFDKKYIHPTHTMENYVLSKKQIIKGLSFGIYIVQIPLILLIIISYILIIPMPFLSSAYSMVYIGLPFIFLFFFGFEVIFRTLIQEKIKGNKVGEFCIGTLFYAQFIGIFGYLIFMNSYSSVLVISGLPISYSGLFGLIFVLFAIIGTINYMITRTPVASSISNTLILFFILALVV